MKKMMCISVIITACFLLMPLAVMGKEPQTTDVLNTSVKEEKYKSPKNDVFRVLDKDSGKVSEMTAEDYIFGVVAAEMPALYETEALKAQAVAAYTYACYKRNQNAGNSYDITTDYNTDQSFISESLAKERWGDKADEYAQKIKNAIKEVDGIYISFNGQPILAVYHAVSWGKTADAKDVWGKEIPYLKGVASDGDKLSNNYISTVVLGEEEFKKCLYETVDFEGEPENYFGKFTLTDSGSVKTVKICQDEISGSELRSKLELNSNNFTVQYSDGEFTFTVYGRGHGVGMSQCGADYMAKQGSDFKEILCHYYSNCELICKE